MYKSHIDEHVTYYGKPFIFQKYHLIYAQHIWHFFFDDIPDMLAA
jgi:hypothetical protein